MRLSASAFIAILFCPAAFAQADPVVPPHEWWWLSAQANFITQAHARFRSPYESASSLPSAAERKSSRLYTFFTGLKLGPATEFLLDVESAGGRGIGDALGVAGFTNLDVVRNPSLGSAPYIARIMLHHVFRLSKDNVAVNRGPSQLFSTLPATRLEIHVGKMSLPDFFDSNSVGSDSHLQFTNWTVDNNGAYDYAADTRGYTYGAVFEFVNQHGTARFAEALMPKVANGIHLDANLTRSRGENFEYELRKSLVNGRTGALRTLAYVNHANMGNYREVLQRGRRTHQTPDITADERPGRVKYGFGLNAEQEVTHDLRAFARWGWNEGHNESFAYTEVNDTWVGGADFKGTRWKRVNDKVGAAFVSNGISGDHRAYLMAGGLGFLLGDGSLRYGREKIVEFYYFAHLYRGISISFDIQRVTNPGYNRDRGPVLVPGFRIHLEDHL